MKVPPPSVLEADSDEGSTALCGKCRVPLTGPEDAKDDDVFSCPDCGNGDTLANVTKIIGEYAEDHIGREMDKMLKKAARGNSMLSYKSKPKPHKSYRFVLDLR